VAVMAMVAATEVSANSIKKPFNWKDFYIDQMILTCFTISKFLKHYKYIRYSQCTPLLYYMSEYPVF
jgi:hypothetical protein